MRLVTLPEGSLGICVVNLDMVQSYAILEVGNSPMTAEQQKTMGSLMRRKARVTLFLGGHSREVFFTSFKAATDWCDEQFGVSKPIPGAC